jgi:hypothetical protein
MMIDNGIDHFEALLRQAEKIKFDHYDQIVLSAERVKFCKLNPQINNMLICPDGFRNKGGVDNGNKKEIADSDYLKQYKQQKIEGGYIRIYPNAIKLYITNIGDKKAIRKRFRDAIRYLIENKYILAVSTEDHIINYYLRKFRYNEIEFNSIFQSPGLFDFLHKTYNLLEYEEHAYKLEKFGSRKVGAGMEKAVEIDMNLSSHETTIYLWENESSKFYLYNIPAKKEKRDFHKPGDDYKAELTARKEYLKNTDHRHIDHEILNSMERSVLFQKAYDAIIKPIRCARADAMMRAKLNKKWERRMMN